MKDLTDFFSDNDAPVFLKAGIYGAAGTGKTRTAYEIASGLIKEKKLDKPVLFFDTEKGSDWILPLVRKDGIQCYVKKSRTFRDLLKATEIAENEASVFIVDSISHVWRELCNSYLEQYNRDRKAALTSKYGEDWVNKNFKKALTLEFQHWSQIKPAWGRFTDKFLNSSLHMIVCGRAGDMYEYQENENGKKELIKNGTRMATEKELSYEPSLLIEMRRKIIDGKERLFGYVEKDRSDSINGMEFELPKYENFKPHIDFMNIGGIQKGSNFYQNESGELFKGNTISPEDEFAIEKRKRTEISEDIEGILKMKYPGQDAESKKAKLQILNETFNTTSWTAIQNMGSDKLSAGLKCIRDKIASL